MPLYMRTAKLRGNTSADAMPIGPFRTYTQPVNVRDLDRFEAGDEVTPESLKAKGLIRSVRKDVKLLGVGELTKKLAITVHGASATAREKVEAAGGTLTLLREPKVRKPKNLKRRPEGRTRRRQPSADDDAPRRAEREPRSEASAAPGSPTPGGSRSSGAGSSSRRRCSRPTASARGCRLRASTRSQIENYFNGQRRLAARPAQPVLGLGAVALLDLRARDHAVRHGVDHPAAPDGRHPEARAAAERGRGGLREDQPVHPLPDRRPRGRAGGRATRTSSTSRARCPGTPAASC